jgi:hypothetical protein
MAFAAPDFADRVTLGILPDDDFLPVTKAMPGRARSCAALQPGAFPSKATPVLVGHGEPTIDFTGRSRPLRDKSSNGHAKRHAVTQNHR